MTDTAPAPDQVTTQTEAPSPAPENPKVSSAAAQKPNFPHPSEAPTQKGPRGIRYDFNHGARVVLPSRTTGQWRIRLTDLDTGNILFQSDNQGAFIRSSKRFFVRFGIQISEIEEDGTVKPVFTHEQEVRDRPVLIHLPVGTLGDTMGWFPYAARFAEEKGAQVTVSLSKLILPLFKDSYPHITLVSHEEVEEKKLAETAYATYCIGLFFDDAAFEWQPTDFRHVGLHRTAGYILGVDPTEEAPRLSLPDESRPIAEPYVCIAVQASTQAKMWNNPNGWREVIAFLKERGFRVICIDQKPVHGQGIVWNHIPHGAEDETGDRPLAERARWLRHASAFIGLSSGLAWLAWATGCPTVMISGFTHPDNEFDTPYRIINWHTCNSCWNDVRHRFDHTDYLYCPRHKGTDRHLECTRLITSTQVIGVLKRVPELEPRV